MQHGEKQGCKVNIDAKLEWPKTQSIKFHKIENQLPPKNSSHLNYLNTQNNPGKQPKAIEKGAENIVIISENDHECMPKHPIKQTFVEDDFQNKNMYKKILPNQKEKINDEDDSKKLLLLNQEGLNIYPFDFNITPIFFISKPKYKEVLDKALSAFQRLKFKSIESKKEKTIGDFPLSKAASLVIDYIQKNRNITNSESVKLNKQSI